MPNLKPGLFPGVPFADYLKWPIPSQSTLKHGRESMAHLKAAMDGERFIEPTDDMILGTALHTAYLEPSEAEERISVWAGGRRYGKEWTLFREANKDKIIITESQEYQLAGMVESLRRCKIVRNLIDDVEVELGVVGYFQSYPLASGWLMKARCDVLSTDAIIDLKKVRTADPRKFTYAAIEYGYHIQAAVYRKLFDRDRFILVCVEDQPPYDVVPYELSPAFVRAGETEAARIIERAQECERTGIWPGRSGGEVCQLEPPEWLLGDALDLLEM
jgi:hypothetical protein